MNGLLRSAKCRYITELASAHKGYPSKFWSYFRYLVSCGNKYASPADFSFHADDLNMHFLSIPSRTVQSLPISSVSPLSYVSEVKVPPLNLTAVTEDVVISIICKFDPKKATGCDNLSIRFIRACPEAMAKLLTVIVNKSVSTGRLPEFWKCAIVTLVQKSKDSSLMTNLRPISVLPAFSKELFMIS